MLLPCGIAGDSRNLPPCDADLTIAAARQPGRRVRKSPRSVRPPPARARQFREQLAREPGKLCLAYVVVDLQGNRQHQRQHAARCETRQ